MDWLMDDYRKETWKAIDEAVNQVLNEVSTVADIKGLKPVEFEDYVKSPYHYNVFGNDIDGRKVCKIIKEVENNE
jgi:hypothetical protein